jgi:CDP-glucose 4,6-dehydratase
METYTTNVIGTANLLEAIRTTTSVKAVVIVTTDKCYENREWEWGYRENDPVGGHDPYSSSKACVEILTTSWRRSFLEPLGIRVASARAGNVLGGGDWSDDRLLPDFLRALDTNKPLVIRSPDAIRPWQHVLEPLSGYILLAEKLLENASDFAQAWNFGPNDEDAKPVNWMIRHLKTQCPDVQVLLESSPQPHEANYLKLDISKARKSMGWQPRWRLAEALERTVEWHKAWRQGKNMSAFSLIQIADYTATQTA